MQQTIQSGNYRYKLLPSSSLTVVKGGREYGQQLNLLTNVAWKIAHTALWNATEFSNKEEEGAKDFIRNFIQKANNPVKAFSEFTQRVLLARMYILSHPGKYAPYPSRWFKASNSMGFAGTSKWFQTITMNRYSQPTYKLELKAFGEAVVEVAETNSSADFNYWRTYFIERRCKGLLSLYLSTVAICQNDNYSNNLSPVRSIFRKK
jgi:hypothetical protein